MKTRKSKKSIIIASVTVGLIGLLLTKLLKRALANSSIVKKISYYKKVGLNSVKDFLELGELRLRLEELDGGIKAIYDGTKIVWDSDGSKSYIIIISPEYISKTQALNIENIIVLSDSEIQDLKISREWIRKVIITAQINKYSSNYSERDIKTNYIIPFEKFQCRVISSNGRLSRLLTFPERRKQNLNNQEIKCWLTKFGNNNYLNISNSRNPGDSRFYDYKVVIYVKEGKGLVKSIPDFKTHIKFDLGILPPCLCYIFAMRKIGAPLEQFVGWIGEDHSFIEYSDEELNKFNIE